jgi:hypothetical protein
LQGRRKAKAPPPVAHYDWSGVYVGLSLGGVWAEVDRFYPRLDLVGLVPQTLPPMTIVTDRVEIGSAPSALGGFRGWSRRFAPSCPRVARPVLHVDASAATGRIIRFGVSMLPQHSTGAHVRDGGMEMGAVVKRLIVVGGLALAGMIAGPALAADIPVNLGRLN